MDMGIKGRKAIVCAASKGLGKGCATALARGRSMEGEMGVSFSFTYVLRPEQL